MEVLKYQDSGIDERIIRAVAEMGFENMTPIQEQAIPVLLEGKDIIGQAQTGTGKTAAFGIPLVQSIDPENKNLQAVVLCPTRELAIQAAEEMRKFSKYMHNVKMVPIYGGQDITRQIKALKGGVQIIVGTPGRVMDHMRRRTIKMDNVKMVVLDEADEMLNMGFREDMETILKEMPAEHQTALFSATMPKAILEITDTYQKDAVMVKVAATELTIPLVQQIYFVVKNQFKEEVVSRLMQVNGLKRSIIFCNTKRMVDELSENLKKRGYTAEGLHGDLSQKQRDFVMNRFRSGNLQVLIATDVAARGIDVDDVEAVFNYDIPQDIEYYVHRIGRTGRAGKEGVAYTFAYGRDMYKIRDIERICKSKMTEAKVPSAKEVTALKAEKILNDAKKVSEKGKLEKLVDVLESYISENDEDPIQFMAALLKMQMGDEIQEIVMEAPRTMDRGHGRGNDGRYRSNDGRGQRNDRGVYGDRGRDSRSCDGGSRDGGSRDGRGRRDDRGAYGDRSRRDDRGSQGGRVDRGNFEGRSRRTNKEDSKGSYIKKQHSNKTNVRKVPAE